MAAAEEHPAPPPASNGLDAAHVVPLAGNVVNTQLDDGDNQENLDVQGLHALLEMATVSPLGLCIIYLCNFAADH